ncbi:MAG: glycosyltransferase [Prevotellaceae bacterium]|nr:glycosyltransferase [Prevotellaceae bacterium]
MKKKILFFVSGEVGGAERITITIAKMLDKSKFDVKLVITAFPDCKLSKFTPDDIPVIYLSEKHLRFGCMMKMKDLIKKENTDYVFGSMTFVCILLLIVCKFFASNVKPIVRGQINPHYWVKQSGLLKYKGAIVEKINRFLFPSAYKVVAQTPTMCDGMIKYYGVKPEKCICLYNPIDWQNINEKIKEESPYSKGESDCFRYVAVGRCQPQKGFDLLIEAMKKVVAYNPLSHVYIIGAKSDDAYTNYLLKLVKDNQLDDNIHFTGFQTNPYKYIKYGECFVLSSRDEGLPNVLIEATYLHKQAVAYTCIPIIKEIVQDGKNGLLVEAENVDKLADAMIKIQTLDLNVASEYKPSCEDDFNRLFE